MDLVDLTKYNLIDKMKLVFTFLTLIGLLFLPVSTVHAGWVNGYFRSNGTYVNGYYRTDPDLYKWNNYSFDNDWSDSYNDRSYYRSYGYDPEPWDDDYVDYSYGSSWNYDDDWNNDDDYDSNDWDW